MASERQKIKQILGLTVAILLTHVCVVETNNFPQANIALQFSYTDELHHHIRQRRADSYKEYTAEVEINASNISVLNEMKNYLNILIQNSSISSSVELLHINFTTVCNLGTTDYQCRCEDEYFWPCDKCKDHGSCSATNDTCSCINTLPRDGQFCQPISGMTDNATCTQPPTTQPPTTQPPTTQPPTTQPPTTQPPTAQTPVHVINMSLKIKETFYTSLSNSSEKYYKEKAEVIQTAIEEGYKDLAKYIKGSAKVTGFRSGSVIADYTINATASNLDFTSANQNIYDIFESKGMTLAQNAFSLSEQGNLSTATGSIYPYQSMTLNCSQFVNGTIKWTLNEKDLDMNKYSFSGNNSTLTLNNATDSDGGRYSCIIQNSSIPYIQWQDIVIQQQPEINVGEDELAFPCEQNVVQLKCCVNANYSIEWVLNGNVTKSGSECITMDYVIVSGSCTKENFTCRLKDLQQLHVYSYSKRSVTVSTSNRQFNCRSDTLGYGITNDVTEGPCPKDMEGNITYKCESGSWTLIKDNCVVKIIQELDSRVEDLVVEKIPEFMADLSNAAVKNDDEITESAATVQTIVHILSTIAHISNNIIISKPVIEDFLSTVDIIISDGSKQAWEELNNGSVADNSNTSIELLQAIETISSHLSDDKFDIIKSSTQLSRTITDDGSTDLNVTSKLTNSTTYIFIPNVPTLTSITIIFFSNLANVLPTRNTSNIDSGKLNNSINGDVVVVKVNKTINNISFSFDLTNTSLKNPQCVFWNFDVNYWDSTGCKVKLQENESVTCECDHTTSFSILMSPFAIDHKILDYITYIGVAVSMASLILCLIIEIIVWKSVTRNDTSYMRHVSIVNIAVSLLIANIWFIIGAAIAKPGASTPVNPCSAAVFFIHFFYLALFFWMFISALLLLYRTVMVLSQMSRAKMMLIAFTVGYCAPLLIAVITVASTAGAGRYIWTRDACWLNWSESKALLAFVIPALTIVFFNLLVLIVVVCKMLRRGVGATTQPDERHTLMVIVRCLAFLTPIFGITWGFGIGTMVSPNFGVHVVFAILNSFQGFFVLLFGILLDSKIREALAGKLSLKNLTSIPTRSTNAGTSSSSALGFFERLRRRNVYNVSNPGSATSANSSGAFESLTNN